MPINLNCDAKRLTGKIIKSYEAKSPIDMPMVCKWLGDIEVVIKGDYDCCIVYRQQHHSIEILHMHCYSNIKNLLKLFIPLCESHYSITTWIITPKAFAFMSKLFKAKIGFNMICYKDKDTIMSNITKYLKD